MKFQLTIINQYVMDIWHVFNFLTKRKTNRNSKQYRIYLKISINKII